MKRRANKRQGTRDGGEPTSQAEASRSQERRAQRELAWREGARYSRWEMRAASRRKEICANQRRGEEKDWESLEPESLELKSLELEPLEPLEPLEEQEQKQWEEGDHIPQQLLHLE